MEKDSGIWLAIYLGMFPLAFVLTLILRRGTSPVPPRAPRQWQSLEEAKESEEKAYFSIWNLGKMLVLIAPALLGWKAAIALQNWRCARRHNSG